MNGGLAPALPRAAQTINRQKENWLARGQQLMADAWLELASRRHGPAASNQRVTVLRPVVVGRV